MFTVNAVVSQNLQSLLTIQSAQTDLNMSNLYIVRQMKIKNHPKMKMKSLNNVHQMIKSRKFRGVF